MTKPFRFGVQAGGPIDPEGWIETARQAESLGYSTLSMADHFDRPLAPIPALAMAASATTDLHLAAMVFCNDFRHPAVLAHDAATLDLLSDGRFELGIGAGWQLTDYTQSGIAHESAGIRIARLAEAVEIIKNCFHAEAFSFTGEHYTIDDLVGWPCSPSHDRPPIFIGGGGPKMLRTAAQIADIVGINPNLSAGVFDHRAGPDATLARARTKVGWIREAAGERFDDLELQVRVHIAAITNDPVGMAEMLAPPLGISAEDAMTSPHALCGSVDETIDRLRSLREDLGVSYFTWGADSMVPMAPVVAKLTGVS